MHKEEEFKKVLKKLLLEKQKQELTRPEPVFNPDPQSSIITLKDHLKTKIRENEGTQNEAYPSASQDVISDLKNKLEKIRPTLKKLMSEVRRSQEYIQQLEEEKKDLEDELGLLKKNHLRDLEYSQKDRENIHQELIRLREQLKTAKDENSFSKNVHYEEEIRALKKEIENLHYTHQERQKEWEEIKSQDFRHLHQLDNERQRLVERLAESVSQMQRQADYIKEIRDEISQNKQKIHQYQTELTIRDKESEDLGHQLSNTQAELKDLKGLFNDKESENQLLKEKIFQYENQEKKDEQNLEFQENLKQRLEESESLVEKLKKEMNETKEQNNFLLNQQKEEEIIEKRAAEFWSSKLSALLQDHEIILKEKEKDYQSELQLQIESKACLEVNIKELTEKLEVALSKHQSDKKEIENLSEVIDNFRVQYHERESELRKAQLHLAKKIKESTLLRDLIERQKVQLIELQNALNQNKGEVTRLQNHLNLQRQHEEKLHLIAKERAVNAEEQSKTWQQKFLELQSTYVNLKLEWNELIKIKKSYDQILQTINHFKLSLESIPSQQIKINSEEEFLLIDSPVVNE